MKAKDDEIEELVISRKKTRQDQESLQTLIDELRANNAKLEKSKKRLQEEVGTWSITIIITRLSKHFYRVALHFQLSKPTLTKYLKYRIYM